MSRLERGWRGETWTWRKSTQTKGSINDKALELGAHTGHVLETTIGLCCWSRLSKVERS